MLVRIALLLVLLLVPLACQLSVDEGTPSGGETLAPPPVATAVSGDGYSVYFTDPQGSASKTLRGGPDQALAEAIRKARLSVDVAAYQLDLWSMRDALLEAYRKGVSVRMVVESDNQDEAEMQQLKDAGIPILCDRREGLMHNKFVVIDRREVWTGSMNFTVSGAYRSDNNLIRIRSSRVAQDYTTEFEEMFVDDQFGPGSPANTPYPAVTLDGMPLEVYFSPDDGVEAHLIELVKAAQESVYFLAFSFTSDDLAAAMLERSRAGVTVAGVFEEYQYKTNRGTEYESFASAGLDVRLDGNPDNMHHKVIIIDERIVVTGSYNFSYNAETLNDENVLVIDHAGIAALYLAEFQRVFAEAQE